jgi:hypothetical protein
MRRAILGAGALIPFVLWAAPALARRGVRPIFEPTDLELEKPGVMEVDLQVGAIQSRGPARLVVPDFEVDFGILPNLELDVDGAYAIEGPAAGPFAFDHAAPDSLWVGAKIGLFDWGDDDSRRAWALGLQAGPKLPVAAGTHGVGGEALLLVGHTMGATHLVLNSGAFVDPRADPAPRRPIGVELGLDVEQELGSEGGRWSLTAELAGVLFISPDPRQLLATAGIVFAATETLDLSLTGLYGFFEGNDRYGALLGFSPKLRFLH